MVLVTNYKMKVAKVNIKDAQKVKTELVKKGLIDTKYQAKKKGKFLFLAITSNANLKNLENVEIVDEKLEKKPVKETLTSLLKEKLSEDELKLIPKTQEIVGDIMVLEIPESLETKEKESLIAKTYLKLNKNVKTIVKKTAIHSGTFRTRGVKVIAGEKRKNTIHLENGVKIKLHLEKTYFSARLSNERLRIAKLVKKGESILVMFSGSAPYPLVLGKHSEAKKILGVEINPDAHKFGLENVKLNKFKNIIDLINGDVREILPKMKEKFDRILMPLPKTSEEFLDVALPRLKENGIIHLYAFLNEKDINSEAKRVEKLCEKLMYPVKILKKVKCGQHAPYTFRVCFDLRLN
jgi:tRNA (guanine37-N1)-methyltransferase